MKTDKSEKNSNDIELTEPNPAQEADDVSNLESEISQLRDRYLRKAAEFENYRKRTEAEKINLITYANEKLILELIPVLDDLERALSSSSEESNNSAFHQGVMLIYEKLKKILEKQGLKEIESTGKEFDINLHDAVMQKESDDHPQNLIIETLEKGYFLKDKVLRHAKVIVSAGKGQQQ